MVTHFLVGGKYRFTELASKIVCASPKWVAFIPNKKPLAKSDEFDQGQDTAFLQNVPGTNTKTTCGSCR